MKIQTVTVAALAISMIAAWGVRSVFATSASSSGCRICDMDADVIESTGPSCVSLVSADVVQVAEGECSLSGEPVACYTDVACRFRVSVNVTPAAGTPCTVYGRITYGSSSTLQWTEIPDSQTPLIREYTPTLCGDTSAIAAELKCDDCGSVETKVVLGGTVGCGPCK